MATKFTEIYNRAMFRFTDFGFLNIYAEKRDEIMRNFLMSAIADFKHSCTVDLTDFKLDEENGDEFNKDVGFEEQEILACGVAYYWLSQKALNTELLRNSMTRKDYTTYSPANLLDRITALRDSLKSEFRAKINEYSYRHGTLGDIKADDN